MPGSWRRRLGVEAADIQLGEVGGDVFVAAVGIPSIELIPIAVGEVGFAQGRPSDHVAAVIGGQKDAVRL